MDNDLQAGADIAVSMDIHGNQCNGWEVMGVVMSVAFVGDAAAAYL